MTQSQQHSGAFPEYGYCKGCKNIDASDYCLKIRENVHSSHAVLRIETVLYKCGCKHGTRSRPDPAPHNCDWDEPKGMCAECEYRTVQNTKPCDHCVQEIETRVAEAEKAAAAQARDDECKRISTEITRILREHPRIVNRFFLQELEESLRTPEREQR
jgi:hypothetical protein